MTLPEIKNTVAALLSKSATDLTVEGVDLFLIAINQVRREAELLHDFEFSRKSLTLSVNGVTGGSIGDAVIYGTSTTVLTKTVIDIGVYDDFANLRPSEWTTASESLERARSEQRHYLPRYPTDQELRTGPVGSKRFVVSGNQIFHYSKDSTTTFVIGLEVYTFQADWVSADLTGTLTVTGTLSPDLTGNFSQFGTFGTRPAYYNEALTGYIYYNGTKWILASTTMFVVPTNYFSLTNSASYPTGTYSATGTYTGTPVITSSSSFTDDWLTYGSTYLIWATVIFLNHKFKTFVFRQEGNLAPPEKMRDTGLAAFIEWDSARFETNRRHGR